MKFLLNMNLPREIGKQLATKAHLCRHIGDIGFASANDVASMEEAKSNNEIIVTHDLDYGHLLAFSGETAPSVIIFRFRNTQPGNMFAWLIPLAP